MLAMSSKSDLRKERERDQLIAGDSGNGVEEQGDQINLFLQEKNAASASSIRFSHPFGIHTRLLECYSPFAGAAGFR